MLIRYTIAFRLKFVLLLRWRRRRSYSRSIIRVFDAQRSLFPIVSVALYESRDAQRRYLYIGGGWTSEMFAYM